MIFNYSISQLSLNLILIAPFISRPPIYEKGIIESYYKIKCSNFLHSFLYSKSNTITRLKESSFSKFNGHCPIFLNTIDCYNHYQKLRPSVEIKDPTSLYDGQQFSEQLYFAEYQNISTTFTNCQFDNCYNQYGPGGAISFRKNEAFLCICSCRFIKCRAQYNAGAIFIQVSNGGWIQDNANILNSCFEECYDCKPDSNYVSGVIEAFVAKTKNNCSFSLNHTQFKNCQFDVKNKIVEGQMRLNSNIFHIHYDNITNNLDKIDASSFLFSKYVQEYATLSFLNGFNQRVLLFSNFMMSKADLFTFITSI